MITAPPMTRQKRELRGVLPVFQTPWLADETLDLETLEREIAWLHDCGARRHRDGHGVGDAAAFQRGTRGTCGGRLPLRRAIAARS